MNQQPMKTIRALVVGGVSRAQSVNGDSNGVLLKGHRRGRSVSFDSSTGMSPAACVHPFALELGEKGDRYNDSPHQRAHRQLQVRPARMERRRRALDGRLAETVGPSPTMCYVVRLRPGEELKSTLMSFCAEMGLRVSKETGEGGGGVFTLQKGDVLVDHVTVFCDMTWCVHVT